MLLLRDECSLCKRIVSSSILRRCFRCGKLYCFDCSTFTKDGSIVCLNCARRMVSPRRLGTKYSPLSRYLLRRAQFTEHMVLPFADVEGVIGDNLPLGAVREVEWWANTRGTAQGRAWTDVGWRVQDVNLDQRTVNFIRVAESKVEIGKSHEKKAATPTFAKKMRRFSKPRRREQPSKTRFSLAQAKLRNVERERASSQRFKAKFKPRPAHEKRLFKPEAKPSEATN